MRKTIIVALFSLFFLSISLLSHGSGFLTYEHCAAAMAMGGSFIAVANNPTAIFYNPAGISWLNGTQVSAGATLVTSLASLDLDEFFHSGPWDQYVDAKRQWLCLSNVYVSHRISDRLTTGFGFFSPYNWSIEWPHFKHYLLDYSWAKDKMRTFFFNPVLAFKVDQNLSLAAGFSYVHSTFRSEFIERLGYYDAFGSPFSVPITVAAKGSGWGLNAGMLYRSENFSAGFNWRGNFKVKYEDGDLELDLSQSGYSDLPGRVTGTASTSFNLPHIFGLGAAFRLSERLLLSTDLSYVLWSRFNGFVIEAQVPTDIEILFGEIGDRRVIHNWVNSYSFRVGIQYQVKDGFYLRTGFFMDQTPQPREDVDLTFHDADRWSLTGGFGFKSGKFILDFAYQLELFANRIGWGGKYSTTAHLIGMSINFSL
jgi:long-chain fatty acid transport protein